MLEKTAALFERDATDRRPAVAEGTAADLPRKSPDWGDCRILCSCIRPNEAFGGKGERARICRKCRKMPREKRDVLMYEREILGFLEQSHISPRNLARLKVLGRSENPRVADLAHLVLDVGATTPDRKSVV